MGGYMMGNLSIARNALPSKLHPRDRFGHAIILSQEEKDAINNEMVMCTAKRLSLLTVFGLAIFMGLAFVVIQIIYTRQRCAEAQSESSCGSRITDCWYFYIFAICGACLGFVVLYHYLFEGWLHIPVLIACLVSWLLFIIMLICRCQGTWRFCCKIEEEVA